jgi:phosphoethanolamine N-methyltransferase
MNLHSTNNLEQDSRHDSLREYAGKQLVSFLRKGDFAHAGEEEAIDLAFSNVEHGPEQTILDVGCGLGGTAAYIQNHHLGQVTGLDIEREAILYAQKKYSEIPFHCCDVLNAADVITQKFDIICLFNAFYAFSEPLLALRTLNKLVKVKGKIIIFDYSDPCVKEITPLFNAGKNNTSPFRPIPLHSIDFLLEQSSWQPVKRIDLSLQYIQWYTQLINRLLENETEIIHLFSQSLFQKALDTYLSIKRSLVAGLLGGILLYAEKV